MNKLLLLLTFALMFAAGCGENEETKTNDSEASVMSNQPHVVKVVDLIQTSDYTYLDVKEGENTFWIAVPNMKIEKGEMLYFSKSMLMKDFESPTLGRKFDSVLFVEDARKSSDPNKVNDPHSNVQNLGKENIKIDPLSSDRTIASIYSNKENLSGKTVKLRGKVVKYNPNIMKRNWIHLQDGTGTTDDFDIVVTTTDNVKPGDIIVVEGILAVNKDFGAGYFFPVIIEDAKVLKGI